MRMRMLRVPILGALIVVLVAVLLPLGASAFHPPALYRCIVYEDSVPAGPGHTVEAYVGAETEPRGQATTDANSVAIVIVPTTELDFAPVRGVSFTVDGRVAIENPEVDITLAATEVELTVSGSAVVVWPLANGLDEDPAAINPWLYPEDAIAVTLRSSEDTMPEELVVVWHYAGTAEGWKWFRPGWPESTLETLDPGEYYIGIALSATEWEIPQG